MYRPTTFLTDVPQKQKIIFYVNHEIPLYAMFTSTCNAYNVMPIVMYISTLIYLNLYHIHINIESAEDPLKTT